MLINTVVEAMDYSNLMPPAWKNAAVFPDVYMSSRIEHGQICLRKMYPELI